MEGLLLHCGGESATYEQLGMMKLPDRTKTFHPVAHNYVVDRTKRLFGLELGLEVKKEMFGLNKDGAQMFGVIQWQQKGGAWAPITGICNAHDKSLKIKVAMGAKVLVCDNLCFSGDAITVMRKHTQKVLDDLDLMLLRASRVAQANYHSLSGEMESFIGMPVPEDYAYAAFGVLYGRGVLTSTQFNRAAEYWDKPPHEEHANQDLFGWYQAVTHGLKKASPRESLVRHAKLHHRALEMKSEICGWDLGGFERDRDAEPVVIDAEVIEA